MDLPVTTTGRFFNHCRDTRWRAQDGFYYHGRSIRVFASSSYWRRPLVLFARIWADLPLEFRVVSIPANTVFVMLALVPVARVVKSGEWWSWTVVWDSHLGHLGSCPGCTPRRTVAAWLGCPLSRDTRGQSISRRSCLLWSTVSSCRARCRISLPFHRSDSGWWQWNPRGETTHPDAIPLSPKRDGLGPNSWPDRWNSRRFSLGLGWLAYWTRQQMLNSAL